VYRGGHVGFALLGCSPVLLVTSALGHRPLAVVGAVLAGGFATLPDVDQHLPLVPHRGPTHTVWFALVVAWLGGEVGRAAALVAGGLPPAWLGTFVASIAGLAVGTHLVADALTPMGVRPLAPLVEGRVALGLVRASNPVANLLALGLGFGTAGLAIAAGPWVARALAGG